MENNDSNSSGRKPQDESAPGAFGSGAAGHADDSGRSGLSVPETLKKLFTAGLGAAFMTEESVRSFVSEMKLPKETLNLLLQGASKSKEELVNRVGREIVNMVSKIDLVKEASRFVEEHKFKVTAEIEVTRKAKPADKGEDAG